MNTLHDTSVISRALRRVFVPVMILEIIALFDRVVEPSVQFTRPALFAAWQISPFSTIMFFIVLGAIAVGTAVAIMSSVTLLAKAQDAMEDALHTRHRKAKAEQLAALKERVKRYKTFIVVLCVMLLVFGVGYYLDTRSPIIAAFTILADCLAPLLNIAVIGLTERDHERVSPQQNAMIVASDKLVSAVGAVTITDGKLSKTGSELLRSGKDGNLDGMLDAITERDETDVYYSIADICRRLHIPADRNHPQRKRVYNVINRGRQAGETGIRTNARTHALEVPGRLWDKLFGDFTVKASPAPVPAVFQEQARQPAPIHDLGIHHDPIVFPRAFGDRLDTGTQE